MLSTTLPPVPMVEGPKDANVPTEMPKVETAIGLLQRVLSCIEAPAKETGDAVVGYVDVELSRASSACAPLPAWMIVLS